MYKITNSINFYVSDYLRADVQCHTMCTFRTCVQSIIEIDEINVNSHTILMCQIRVTIFIRMVELNTFMMCNYKLITE